MPQPTVFDLDRKIRKIKRTDPMGLLCALHESGHAIAAICVGASVKQIALECVNDVIVSGFIDLVAAPDDPDDHLFYLAGGAAAETLVFKDSFGRIAADAGLTDDVSKIAKILRDEDDFSGDVFANCRFLRAFHSAMALMESESIVVKYLALALFEEGSLDAEQIEHELELPSAMRDAVA